MGWPRVALGDEQPSRPARANRCYSLAAVQDFGPLQDVAIARGIAPFGQLFQGPAPPSAANATPKS